MSGRTSRVSMNAPLKKPSGAASSCLRLAGERAHPLDLSPGARHRIAGARGARTAVLAPACAPQILDRRCTDRL